MNQIKYLHDNDPWILAEEIPDIDFQFSQIWLSSFVNNLETSIGVNYKKVLCVYDRGYNLKFYYGDKDSEYISRVILDKIVHERFGVTINTRIRQTADELYNLSKKITPTWIHGLTNKELADFYVQLDTAHTEFYSWGWLPNAVDMFHGHFTNHLKEILAKKVSSTEEVNTALVALSFCEEKSFVQDEHDSLLRAALYKQQYPDDTQEFELLLQKHYEQFFYLKHLWVGKDGVATLEDYRKQVQDIIVSGNAEQLKKQEEDRWQSDKNLRDMYEQKLSLTAEETELFRVYAEFAFTKAYRRRVQLYWAYVMDFVFESLAQRLSISFIESRFLLPQEVDEALHQGVSLGIKQVVSQRVKHCVYYAEKDLDIVSVGESCAAFESTVKSDDLYTVTEVSGQVACLGKVQGMVKIVNSPSDISKVNEGDVLVSIATNPDILPAMKKAVAFVTEQGGITSHAAIVAREMKKPCIIGTKIATKVFKDGDIVEVDANVGTVKIIHV